MQENVKGIIKSREIIQKLARKEMKVSFGENDENLENFKAWVGDKEVFGVISKGLGESKYSRLSASLQAKVYKNCSMEDMARSAVLRMNSPPIAESPEEAMFTC